MTTIVPPPSRSDLGDFGRRRGAGDDFNVEEDSTQATNTGDRRDMSWTVSPTQPYEGEIKRLFRVFFDFFTCTDERAEILDPDCTAGFYRQSLERICQGDRKVLQNLSNDSAGANTSTTSGFVAFPIRVSDIQSFGPELVKWVLEFPADVLVYADEELRQLISSDILPKLGIQQPPFAGIRVSFYDLPVVCALRDLDPTQLERLVAVKGTVIRASQVIPEMQIAVFRCTSIASHDYERMPCNNEVSEMVINGNVTEPTICTKCQGRRTFLFVHEKCVFSSKQMMKLQENPESIPEGETPQTLFVYLYDALVDSARPGDRVVVTGIFRAVPVRKTVRVRSLKSVFRTAIDVVHIAAEKGADLDDHHAQLDGEEDENMQDMLISAIGAPQMTFHPSMIARAKALAEQPNVYEMLVDSFAPNIWENLDIKKGLLCQLFGGCAEMIHFSEGPKRIRTRGEIHVLLCGDPSTAKSQFLQYVHKIAPRGVYAVGRGTSAAGLTATVTRDPESKDFVLESGAVVLSDRGICCIDEFDKMDDSTRAILHEVMEQQTVSLAKAGIVCSLNARTAILASANPVKSRYDTRKSVIENISLPSTLLSRFDLIYLMLDAQNEELDRKLAEHLCDLYTVDERGDTRTKKTPPLDRNFLTTYISYARKASAPKLSQEAIDELIGTYLTLRQSGKGGSLTATPRQLDSLVRLSKALARMQLRDNVQALHVKEAARLIRAATYQALVDPLTGRIDFDQLHHGLSAAQRARQALLGNFVVEILNDAEGESISKDDLNTRVEEKLKAEGHPTLQRKEFDRAMEHFEQTRLVAKVHGHKYIRGFTD